MELIEKIQNAIAAKDASKLGEFKAEAEVRFKPLRASGQRVYIQQVEALLKQLAEVPRVKVSVPPSGQKLGI